MSAPVLDHTRPHPSLKPVTDAYRARQAALRRALRSQVQAAISTYTASDPLPSLAGIGRQVGMWTTAAQQLMTNYATGYLGQLVAARHGISPTAVAPFPVPDGLVGSTASGATLGALTAAAPNIYTQRLDQFDGDEERAAASAHSYLSSIASSEPVRAGNVTLMDNAVNDPRMTGRFYRSVSPGACDFCAMIADRGYTEASAGFLAHANCSCTPEPEPAYYRTLDPARPHAAQPPVLHEAAPAPAPTAATATMPPSTAVTALDHGSYPYIDQATSLDEVTEAFYDELFNRGVDEFYCELDDAMNLDAAKEYTKSVLDLHKRYPDTKLDRITCRTLDDNVYAWTSDYGSSIELNLRWAHGPNDLLYQTERDTRVGFHHAGTEGIRGVVNHEFGHVLDAAGPSKDYIFGVSYLDANIKQDIREHFVDKLGVDAGGKAAALTGQSWWNSQTSGYGRAGWTKNQQAELVGESIADVLSNGDKATDISKFVYSRAMQAKYGDIPKTWT